MRTLIASDGADKRDGLIFLKIFQGALNQCLANPDISDERIDASLGKRLSVSHRSKIMRARRWWGWFG